MRLIVLLVFSAIFYACSSEMPGDVIEPEKMKLVFFDLVRADELVNSKAAVDTGFKRDIEAKKVYQQVFMLHNITHQQFYKSYNYYQAHPNLNKALFDSLVSYAGKKRAAMDKPLVK